MKYVARWDLPPGPAGGVREVKSEGNYPLAAIQGEPEQSFGLLNPKLNGVGTCHKEILKNRLGKGMGNPCSKEDEPPPSLQRKLPTSSAGELSFVKKCVSSERLR